MNITLSAETERLLREQMEKKGYATPDDAVMEALRTLDELDAESHDELDAETVAAIERAEAQIARGEGIPWEQVRAELEAQFGLNRR